MNSSSSRTLDPTSFRSTVIVDSKESAERAGTLLSSVSHVFLDCEGRELGCVDGALSIISLGTPSGNVFLVDALAFQQEPLTRDDLKPVLSILKNTAVLKIVWDGRNDYLEILDTFGVSTEYVLDLQLVDIRSREARGLKTYRLRKLARRHMKVTDIRKLEHEGLHALSGMDQAIGEHVISSVPLKDEAVAKLHAEEGSALWMRRPLVDFLSNYAAMDIQRLSHIYTHFVSKGYLRKSIAQDPKLYLQSELYVQLFRYLGRMERNDPYHHSNILPLGILDFDPGCVLEYLCVCCVRLLEPRNFPKLVQDRQHSGGYVCRRCIFLDIRREKIAEKTEGTDLEGMMDKLSMKKRSADSFDSQKTLRRSSGSSGRQSDESRRS